MVLVIGQYDSEEGIQIVGHDDEIGAGFICPKAMYSELVHRKIILDLLYPKNVIRVQTVYGKPKSSIVSQIPLNAFLMFRDLAK